MLNLMVKVFSKCKKLNAKHVLVITCLVILLSDLLIILNLPFLRQAFGFFCFTILPGWLILNVLKINKIAFLKKFVLSVGLSVTFLMFAGLLINSFYPVVFKPLSLIPLLVSFNIILLIFAFIAYKRNKNNFNIKDVFNFKLDLKGKLISPLVFPILFPFMAIFGNYLMNTQENNIILLIMLLLIPIYVVAVVLFKNRISDATYPVAIWMISLSLLLMYGLRSNYVMGFDIQREYYTFKQTLKSLHWDIANYHHPYNACLSVSILPIIYVTLLDIQGVYVFKIIYNIIFSITPICVYIISKKYFGKTVAFLSALFFIYQYSYIYVLPTITRQEIALFLFAVSFVIFFDNEINYIAKNILILISIFSITVSHYTTSYIYLILFTSLIIGNRLIKDMKVHIEQPLIFAITLFLWYGQLTDTHIYNLISFIEGTLLNLIKFGSIDLAPKHQIQLVFGKGAINILDKINVAIHDLTFLFIFVGALNLVFKIRYRKNLKIKKEYILLILVSLIILVTMLVLPYLSIRYGPLRLYQQLLVFLAPCFVLGGLAISQMAKLRFRLVIPIVVLLVAQFCFATLVIYQVLGIPQSVVLNNNGYMYDMLYIHDQDVYSAKWLNKYKTVRSEVFCDYHAHALISYGEVTNPHYWFFKNNETKQGYLYLRYANIINKTIYNTFNCRDIKNIKSLLMYFDLFKCKNKIYTNGYSIIYYD
ncbi:MAG: hypothetical protein DRZ80_00320 [Thermoprotei archaeon]|nr:MAG: hypothetical protein DRZ80_00320 [Thermoprotei archaeon]